jgi:hypothetical protein
MISICGVACLGKTSYIKRQPVKFLMDLAERKKQNPFYNDIGTNSFIRQVFTANFQMQKEGIYDRSPLSSAWYNLVFAEMEGRLAYVQHNLKSLTKNELMKFPCIFLVFPKDNHQMACKIVNQMKVRNNGLDIQNIVYVHAQNKIFHQVGDIYEKFGLGIKVEVPSNCEMYSEQYFEELFEILDLAIAKMRFNGYGLKN